MAECIGFQQSSETPVNGGSESYGGLGAGRSLTSRQIQPAVDAAPSQQTLQPAKSNVLLKLFKRFSSVVRSTSKSSAAASSSKTSAAASCERGVPHNAALGPKTIIHEHHHHHHVYHVHHTPGGADHHLFDEHIQAMNNPTRRHSLESHARFDVPVDQPAPHRTAHATFRRRSSEVPRPFKLTRADEQFKSIVWTADHHASK